MNTGAQGRSIGLLLCLYILGGSAHAEGANAQGEAEKAYRSAQSALGAQAWAEAELQFERVLMFNPEHAEARIQLALLLARRGKIEAASGFIESLIDDPRTPPAHRQRLAELLDRLKREPQLAGAEGTPIPAGAGLAAPATPPSSPAVMQASISMGYSANPYARADINNLALTLPDGRVDLPVNQNIRAAPILMSNLSYIGSNRCGFDVQDQRLETSEKNFANKLLLFCYGSIADQSVKAFVSTQRAADGNGRVSAGLAWMPDSWRLAAQVYKEPQLERQGYGLRIDHLRRTSAGTQTLLYLDLEQSTSGAPGYVKTGFSREYALKPGLFLSAQMSIQRDFAGYSALLENGDTRRLVFAELGLRKDWGMHRGWNVSSGLQTGRRWSNLTLFEYKDTTLQLTLSRLI